MIDFLRKLLDLHAELVDDAERVLAEEVAAGPSPPARTAPAER